ncbi:MAG: zinc-ribbon domain containing protein [Chloroflexota bacterium]|nr:zinc-ribbon domain containing protein [Chloroflexota bacterium]
MSPTDKLLHCRDCGQDFVWTAGEQQFYATKGLVNQPCRCTACRAVYHQSAGPLPLGVTRARVAHPVTCAACGRPTTVPFVPRGTHPVYCATCFSHQQPLASGY